MTAITATQLDPVSTSNAHVSRRAPGAAARWTGRVLSGLIALFLIWDAAMKLLRHPMVVAGTTKLGYSTGVIVPLGAILLGAVLLYLVPRTAILGAILLTAYLGGAVATHVRAADPLATHVLFPVYFGVILWLGLWLRDPKLRAITPIQTGN